MPNSPIAKAKVKVDDEFEKLVVDGIEATGNKAIGANLAAIRPGSDFDMVLRRNGRRVRASVKAAGYLDLIDQG